MFHVTSDENVINILSRGFHLPTQVKLYSLYFRPTCLIFYDAGINVDNSNISSNIFYQEFIDFRSTCFIFYSSTIRSIKVGKSAAISF